VGLGTRKGGKDQESVTIKKRVNQKRTERGGQPSRNKGRPDKNSSGKDPTKEGKCSKGCDVFDGKVELKKKLNGGVFPK